MIRRLLFFILMLLCYSTVHAQYADQGTGSLRKELWWFDWAGFNMANGASRTFNTADGLTVTIRFSNVSTRVPQPREMNTWSGAILHLLYNFSHPAIQPALIDERSNATITFTMEISATRNGQPTGFTFIAADAEASDISEITTYRTNGSPWRTIDFFRNTSQTSNPVSGCNTNTVVVNQTYGGGTTLGQNPILSTETTNGSLSVDIQFSRTGSILGGMAVAFGILAPIDRGDLPASYGYAHHRINYTINNTCNFNPPYPSLSRNPSLYIGSTPPDPDGSESTDDNASGVDEEDASSFPIYNGSGTYSLPVTLHNTTGQNAFLTGWFDYNRNGLFDAGERVRINIPPNATQAILTWTGLPVWLLPGTAKGYGFRLRLTTDATASQQPIGFAPDGEVEDYFIDEKSWCSLQVSTNADTTICPGQPVPLLATGAMSYQWDKATYLSDQAIANPVATPINTITYTVTGSTPQGCMATAAVTITTSQRMALSISPNATICPGASTTITAAAPGALSYSWLPQTGLSNANIGTPLATPATDTKYIVTVKGPNGCESKDSVTIHILPPPDFSLTPSTTNLCAGESLELVAAGGDEFTWSANGIAFGNNQHTMRLNPTVDTRYEVSIKENSCQRSTVLSVPISVNPLPSTSVSVSNTITCLVGQATLRAQGGSSYQWDPLPGISQLQSPAPQVSPITTTTYYVTIRDSKGCANRDSIEVLVDFSKNDNKYLVPSAFTPNNDGNNDCFGVKNWGSIVNLQFEVYNRWGQRVFVTNDPSQCWNGRYQGQPQPSGAFTYLIRATTTCGTVLRKGIVMLLR